MLFAAQTFCSLIIHCFIYYCFQGFWLIIVNKHKVLGKYVVLTVHTQGQQLHIYTVHAPAKKCSVVSTQITHAEQGRQKKGCLLGRLVM